MKLDRKLLQAIKPIDSLGIQGKIIFRYRYDRLNAKETGYECVSYYYDADITTFSLALEYLEDAYNHFHQNTDKGFVFIQYKVVEDELGIQGWYDVMGDCSASLIPGIPYHAPYTNPYTNIEHNVDMLNSIIKMYNIITGEE